MNLKMPEFLKHVAQEEHIEVDTLGRLEALVTEFQRQEGRVEDLELQLKDEKERLRHLGQDAIPTLLREHGLSEVRLSNGKKVIVKENISVSVPKEKEAAFFEFLRSRGEEDIIKLHFHFERMEKEQMLKLFAFLREQEYEYSSERGVHPQTLKKYFKDLLGVGDEDQAEGVAAGRYVRKEDVDRVASVFTFFDTKIKE